MDIPKTEYSEEFDKLRKNRCTVSYYKYGSAADNYGKHLIQALPTAAQCVEKYKATGNTEYLVDAANYLMFEFMYPSHPNGHFKATDSGGSAGIVGMSANEIKEFDK